MRHLDAVLATVDGGRWGHMDGWGGGWVWGIAMMVLLVVLIVWVVRSTTDGRGPQQSTRDPAERAREILAERYAHGELTTEEYRERVEQLR